jgi:hypothetical protein
MQVDALVAKYVQLRDKKAQLEQAQKEKLAPVNAMLDKIEGVLLGQFDQLGVDSMKTGAGTAYTSSKTSATVADRDAFLQTFVIPNGAWEYLTNHVNKSAVEAYKAANEELPPGINWSEVRTLNIRRS